MCDVMKEEKQRCYFIDIFRFLMAVFVVAIHTNPLCAFGSDFVFVVRKTFFSLAVPFFFILTGYFLDKYNTNKILILLRKYVFWIFLYSPFIFMLVKKHIDINNGLVLNIFAILSNVLNFYHLWYLKVLILSIPIIKIFSKNLRLLLPLLFSVYILVDIYQLFINNVVSSFYSNIYIFNKIYFGCIFVGMGYYIREIGAQNYKNNILGLIISILLLLIENILKVKYGCLEGEGIFLILVSYFLFTVVILINKKLHTTRHLSSKLILLADYSEKIYFIHPGIVLLLKFLRLREGFVLFVVTLSLSALFTYLINLILWRFDK